MTPLMQPPLKKPARISQPRIALLVPAWNEYGRGIIEGVWQYAQKHGPWLLEMQPRMKAPPCRAAGSATA